MKKKLNLKIFLLIMLSVMGVFHAVGQNIQITGKVIASGSSEAIPGVNVIIKGTTTGVVTDIEGKYKIAVPQGDEVTLVFTFIGYLSSEVKIGTSRIVNVALREDTKDIEEVVVVGYGVQQKESVVGSISVVDNKELKKMPVGNMSQSLTGKVAGIITNQTHGEPGYDDAEIYIRGRATFDAQNAKPLILVDGVERSFYRIDPSEIDQISVLKDASATAVYGVRGANGVILVTTKRGKEGKPKVSFSANTGFQTPTRLPKYLNSYNSIMLFEEALANDGRQSHYSDEDIAKYKQASEGTLTGADYYRYPNVDWYNEILKSNTPEHQANINVSGGTKRIKYFLSGAFFDQQGLYKSTESYWGYGGDSNIRFRRYSFRFNLDFDVTKDLKLSINMGTRFEKRNTPVWDQYSVFSYLNRTPGWTFPVQWEDGRYGANAFSQYNVKGMFERGGYDINNTTVNENSFIAEYKLDFIAKGLSAKGMYSFDNEYRFYRSWSSDWANYEYNNTTGEYIKYHEDTELGYGSRQEMFRRYYAELALNYAHTFAEKHDVSGLLLYNQNDFMEQKAVNPTYSDIPSRYQGLVGRATYNYDRKYFAEVNFGFNGSENFAKGNRFGFFPSLSGGWMISNEDFFKKAIPAIEHLKMRVSYGEVGNDKTYIGEDQIRFLYVSSWRRTSTLFGTTSYDAIYEGPQANLGVSWERAKKANFAIETALKDKILSVDMDIFYEARSGILINNKSIPSLIGVGVNRQNLGATTNKGFELVVKHENTIGSDFKYNINATYALAKNKIIDQDEPDGMPVMYKSEGGVINQYWGLKVDKFFESEEEIANSAPQLFSTILKPGDFKYIDVNKDGRIDELDIAPIGYSDIPEQTFTLGMGCEWKGFEFSMLLQGATHVSKSFFEYSYYEFYNGGGKVQEFHMDRWDPKQSTEYNMANAKYPLLHYDKGQNDQRLNDFHLKDGTYLRLKNLEIAYNIPKHILESMKISSARVFVNGTNLLTLDYIKIRDPEASGKADFYPVMRFMNLGVNVEF